MATSKPLQMLIPEILEHVNKYRETMNYNLRLYKVDQGQIRPEVEDSLRKEMLSSAAYERAKERIPSINVLRKAADKLSKVYSQKPVRLTNAKQDQRIMDDFNKIMEVDKVMTSANRLFNVQHMCAVEPFVQDEQQRLRVLAGHQFLPFSDDKQNPMNMTVFIKFMGSELKQTVADNDKGVRNTQDKEMRNVDVYHLFSDDEFLIIDSDGHIHGDKMAEHDSPWSEGVNPYGVIPQVYINASNFELVPFVNKTALDISILIPKLLTDLNYAAQFLSHSLIWAKNTDLDGVEIHPDTIINLGDGGEDGQPEIGTVDPSVDIEKTLQLVEFQLSGYFSSIGIKTSTVGSMMPGREASGFAKAMDEGDVTAERKVQTEVFKSFERRLWEKIAIIQDYWSSKGVVDDKRKFSKKFVETFSVQFGEMKHLVTQAEKLEKVKTLYNDLKLMSRRQAIKELNPEFTPEQVDQYLEELEEDVTKDEAEPSASMDQPQFNGQTEVGNEEDEVGPNKEAPSNG